MLRIDNLNEHQVVTITATGKLTKEDYVRLLPELEQLFEKFETLRFFILLKDFSGLELDALWQDIKFDYKHKKQFGKTAIAGDKKWEEVGTKISSRGHADGLAAGIRMAAGHWSLSDTGGPRYLFTRNIFLLGQTK